MEYNTVQMIRTQSSLDPSYVTSYERLVSKNERVCDGEVTETSSRYNLAAPQLLYFAPRTRHALFGHVYVLK